MSESKFLFSQRKNVAFELTRVEEKSTNSRAVARSLPNGIEILPATNNTNAELTT